MSWLAVRDRATGAGSTLRPLERLVALCLASHFRDNPSTWPSLRTIGRWTGLSVSTTRRALDVLCGEGGLFVRSLRPGRSGSYEYWLSPETLSSLNSVQPEQCSPGNATVFSLTRNRVQPDNRKRKEGGKEGGRTPSQSKGREPWLKEARAVWAESVGAPPSWFDADLRPLVTPSRTAAAVLSALRAYIAGVTPDKAGTGDFARRIGAWMKRAAKPETEGEPYRATPAQIAEKSRRYLDGEDLAS